MRSIGSSSPRPWAAAILLVALWALPAAAARVQEVRVGDHAEFTRIVLELDGPAPYTLSQRPGTGGGELVVEIEAQSGLRVIGSRSRLVESVRLEPGAGGSVARVQLRSANVNVKEMVLKGPHRIVLDVAAAPAAAAAPKAPAQSTTTPAKSGSNLAQLPPPTPPAPAPTATKPTASAPAPSATKPTASAPAPSAAKQPAPAAAKPAATAPAPTRLAQAPEPEARTAPERRAVERATAAAAGTPTPGPGAGEPEPMAPGGTATPELAPSAEAEAAPGARPRPKPAAEARAARPPAEPPAPEPAPGLVERLRSGDPMVGLSFAVGGVLILLLAFVALRRRSAKLAREAAAAPWPPPGAEERPEFASASKESAEEAWERGDAGPLFAATQAEAAEGEAEPEAEPDAGIPEVPLHVEPEVVAKEADAERVEELERRLERLEARLADNLDARDRLERQLAAHTEELRVQRAAIARTQRAVRAAVRGPEGAGQPGGEGQPAGPPTGES